MILAPKMRAVPASKPTKVDPESDFEMFNEPSRKDKGKGKAARKRKR